MGLIGKTVQSDVKVDGYPMEGTIYYMYCDNCGSFRIRTHLKVIHWLMLVLLLTTIAAGWNYFINYQNFHGNEVYGCWIVYLGFAVVIIGLLSRYFPHQCIKCGNTNITHEDVLDYSNQEDLNRIIDVPEARLHKHEALNRDLDAPLFNLVLLLASLPAIIVVLLPILLYSTIRKKIGESPPSSNLHQRKP